MKKVIVLLLLLLLVGCNTTTEKNAMQKESERNIKKQEITNNEMAQELNIDSIIPSEVIKLPRDVTASFNLNNLDLNKLKENSSKIEISNKSFLGYDTNNKLLFLETDKPKEEETFQGVKVVDLKNNSEKEIKLDKTYMYIDSIKSGDKNISFIASNTGESIDYIKVNSNGDIENEELMNFTGVAATKSNEGFIVNVEQQDSLGNIKTKMLVIPNEPKIEKILSAEGKISDEKTLQITEGSYIGIGRRLENNIGFQLLSKLDPTSQDSAVVDSTYLWNVEENSFKKIEDFKQKCIYFSGYKDMIFTLEEPKIDAKSPEEYLNGYIYLKEDEEYKKYRLPNYNFTTRVIDAYFLSEDKFLISTEKSLDILDLKTKSMQSINFSTTEEKLYYGINFINNELTFTETINGDKSKTYFYNIKWNPFNSKKTTHIAN